MKEREMDFVGRVGRLLNANAPVTPLWERAEDGAWHMVYDVRTRFPPQGTVELVSALAFRLRENDLVAFHPAAANIYRAKFEYRAVAVRKLFRMLGNLPVADVESGRRMLVEDGIEDADVGEWAVRVGDDAVALITLTKGGDGRYRAEPQARLSLRRYDPMLRIDLSGQPELGLLYEFVTAGRLRDTVDWSRDVDFLTAAARSLPQGRDATEALIGIVRGRVADLSGRVSPTGDHDPGVAAELVRAGALERRFRQDGKALDAFADLVRTDPVILALVEEKVRARSEEVMPALAAAAKADVEREMEAERAAATLKVHETISELELAEMMALEMRLRDRGTHIDAEIEAHRRRGYEELEASVSARRSEMVGEAERLESLLGSAKAELDRLDERRADLEARNRGLVEREAALVDRIETLTRSEEALEARARRAALGRTTFLPREGERAIGLRDVGDAAKATKLLTPKGREAVVRLALLMAAREIPVVYGEETNDLVDVAALILASGRIGKMTGDPTTITMEDLWSRPGGNGPTALGDAAEAAARGLPVLAVIDRAEGSGARFWFQSLCDLYRRDGLPEPLLLCLTVEDRHSDEGQAIVGAAMTVEAVGCIDPEASVVAPLVFADPQYASVLAQTVVQVDPMVAMRSLAAIDARPSLGNARRLARLMAAASAIHDEAGVTAVMPTFLKDLGKRAGPPTDAANTISFPGRTAHA